MTRYLAVIAETVFVLFLGGFIIFVGVIFDASGYYRSWWRKYWKQIFVAVLGFCLLGIVCFTCFYFLARKTLTGGKRCDPQLPSVCWGYRIEEYPPRNFCTLTVWYSWRVNNSFSFPTHFGSPIVTEQRWLADGTAVYLFLDNVNTDDSYRQNQKMRVIYDFVSGEIYAEQYSAHWLDLTFDSRRKASLNLAEKDFERILLELDNDR